MSDKRCDQCGGRLNRPGLFRCQWHEHPSPDMAQRIAALIERDICDRRGLKHEFRAIDEEIQDEIRDTWADLIRKELEAR